MTKKAETTFKEKVLKDLRSVGIYCVKIQQVTIRNTPDILACVNGYFIGLELKKDVHSTVEKGQLMELLEIKKAGGFAVVTYPEIWKVTFKNICASLRYKTLK